MNTRDLALKIRKHAVRMTQLGKSSHIGSVLSISDILAVLYGEVLNVRSDDPDWADRDRFILSKGHAGAGVYAALAETGFFPFDLLKSHCQNGSLLSGHVSHKGISGVEFSTGSLGHGLSVGAGIALSAKLDRKEYRTFVLLSDGECDEGSTWEAVLFAGHHGLGNLIAIVDHNRIQSLAPTNETLTLEPFADKWHSFGWSVISVDGHDHTALTKAFDSIPSHQDSQSTCVIANTTKGKGVSFMENRVLWHYRSPQKEEYQEAMRELENNHA